MDVALLTRDERFKALSKFKGVIAQFKKDIGYRDNMPASKIDALVTAYRLTEQEKNGGDDQRLKLHQTRKQLAGLLGAITDGESIYNLVPSIGRYDHDDSYLKMGLPRGYLVALDQRFNVVDVVHVTEVGKTFSVLGANGQPVDTPEELADLYFLQFGYEMKMVEDFPEDRAQEWGQKPRLYEDCSQSMPAEQRSSQGTRFFSAVGKPSVFNDSGPDRYDHPYYLEEDAVDSFFKGAFAKVVAAGENVYTPEVFSPGIGTSARMPAPAVHDGRDLGIDDFERLISTPAGYLEVCALELQKAMTATDFDSRQISTPSGFLGFGAAVMTKVLEKNKAQ